MLRPVFIPEEWHTFLKAQRKLTGTTCGSLVVAALEQTHSTTPGAPVRATPRPRRPRKPAARRGR